MDSGVRFDGATHEELERQLRLPRVELFEATTSTLDVAHRLAAEGVATGTLILANEQTAGRGRGGKTWASGPGAGLWLTLIERPDDISGLDVLSLRVGLAAARALDRFAAEPIRVKWPNDLYIEYGKLAGILVEARWRESSLEWVAIGLGINVLAPEGVSGSAWLDPGTNRIDVLNELIPVVREAVMQRGPLGKTELEEFDARDLARGRKCVTPALGRVAGITANGELLVTLADSVASFRSGSLVLERE
ncbi:MAG: biotin--[acetyl-CoA-carboxylase] ligase [Gemmatimonas sp. 13_1_20CM_3_60_15]|nr:MAG: biotin--[acetyl-CoA-carboxylase] ligase [Gemmatimonas sp. 13_1_20CM_3_60_15]